MVISSWQVWVNDTITLEELILSHVYNRCAKVGFLHCRKDLFMCCQYFHNDISLNDFLWSGTKLTCKRYKRSNEGQKSAKTSNLGYVLNKFKTH